MMEQGSGATTKKKWEAPTLEQLPVDQTAFGGGGGFWEFIYDGDCWSRSFNLLEHS